MDVIYLSMLWLKLNHASKRSQWYSYPGNQEFGLGMFFYRFCLKNVRKASRKPYKPAFQMPWNHYIAQLFSRRFSWTFTAYLKYVRKSVSKFYPSFLHQNLKTYAERFHHDFLKGLHSKQWFYLWRYLKIFSRFFKFLITTFGKRA